MSVLLGFNQLHEEKTHLSNWSHCVTWVNHNKSALSHTEPQGVRIGFPIAIPLRDTLWNATQFLLSFPQDLLRIFRFLLRLICD